MDDLFDDAQQPRCLECGTVLQTARAGYACRNCELVFLGSIAGQLPVPAEERPG